MSVRCDCPRVRMYKNVLMNCNPIVCFLCVLCAVWNGCLIKPGHSSCEPMGKIRVLYSEIVKKTSLSIPLESNLLYRQCHVLNANIAINCYQSNSKPIPPRTTHRYGELDRDEGREKLTGVQLFKATYKHMKKPFQLLIIPLTFWSGVEQGFFGADFTAVSQFGLSLSNPRMKGYPAGW